MFVVCCGLFVFVDCLSVYLSACLLFAVVAVVVVVVVVVVVWCFLFLLKFAG